MKSDGSCVTSLFWVTVGSISLSVVKLFLLGYGKFFVLIKQISLSSLWGVAASAAIAAGVSLVTILQAGDWV